MYEYKNFLSSELKNKMKIKEESNYKKYIALLLALNLFLISQILNERKLNKAIPISDYKSNKVTNNMNKKDKDIGNTQMIIELIDSKIYSHCTNITFKDKIIDIDIKKDNLSIVENKIDKLGCFEIESFEGDNLKTHIKLSYKGLNYDEVNE